MSTPSEQSPLIEHSLATYHEYEMDALPDELRRDSLHYYYLSVYPGLGEMQDMTAPEAQPELPDRVESAYVHTPYCSGVCSFCSYFLTTVDVNDRSPMTEYLEVVKKEVLLNQQQTDLDLSYIYFGGGTPSLIPNKTLEGFFNFLEKNHVLSPTRYGTIELHPEFFQDLTKAQDFINILKTNGIGRVSVGFQSSDEEVLDDTNRRHGTNFLHDAIDFLRQNDMLVSLDLIYGLPGLSLKQWERTLQDAIATNPDSIATYFLFVNSGTAMRTQVERGEVILPSHQTSQMQHIMAQKVLEEAGYFELPNDFYAKVDGDPLAFTQDALPSAGASLPLGAGSYGYYDQTQFFNEFSIAKYRQRVANGETPIWRGHRFDDDGLARRDVMFSLKNSPHINRSLYIERYGADPVERYSAQFALMEQYGLAVVDDTANTVMLTPKGRLCVEEITCLFRIPNLQATINPNTPLSERKKLVKHHFAPTYPSLGSIAVTES